MNNTKFTFADVLIKPKFSDINSRSEVDVLDSYETIPLMTSNMDSVTGSVMAKEAAENNIHTCLHRFWSIEDNVKAYDEAIVFNAYWDNVWCSVGIGDKEYQRFEALYDSECRKFVVDVANGAQKQVADFYIKLKQNFPGVFIVVGNFGSPESVLSFQSYVVHRRVQVDGYKLGIGPGRICKTRIATGVGYPQLSNIIDTISMMNNYDGLFAEKHLPMIIADGGVSSSGDVAKCLAAGADVVMMGGMFAGTDETPGGILGTRCEISETEYNKLKLSNPLLVFSSTDGHDDLFYKLDNPYKTYRGSASKESYEDQGKTQNYIAPEGETITVPYKGPVKNVIQDIVGGLRSSMTYVGARTLNEFREKAEFIHVSSNTVTENGIRK